MLLLPTVYVCVYVNLQILQSTVLGFLELITVAQRKKAEPESNKE